MWKMFMCCPAEMTTGVSLHSLSSNTTRTSGGEETWEGYNHVKFIDS